VAHQKATTFHSFMSAWNNCSKIKNQEATDNILKLRSV